MDSRDELASRYFGTRFDPARFPPELKALLLLVEGDLNASRLFLPRTSVGHEGAVFQAQVVTAYHCLSAFQKSPTRMQRKIAAACGVFAPCCQTIPPRGSSRRAARR